MQNVAALFEIYPPLHDLKYSTDWLMEVAGNAGMFLDPELSNPQWRWHSADSEECKNNRFILIMQSALDDDRIEFIDAPWKAHLRIGLTLFTDASNHEEFLAAESVLGKGLDDLVDYLNSMMLNVLGDWGAEFFKFMFDPDGYHRFEKIAESFDKLCKYCRGSAGPEAMRSLTSGELAVTVNSPSFSVECGSQNPCFIGNNKMFHLLKLLVDSPNRFHSFSHLAEDMGGDALDADTLPALKCRLLRHLRTNGYRVLGNRIRTQNFHYGLFLQQRAIEM